MLPQHARAVAQVLRQGLHKFSFVRCLFHWRRSAISGRPGNLEGLCRSSSDVERANANYYEIVSQLAPATNITSHDANWEDCEDLLDLLGEANSPLISNNEVKLQVLTQISTGENQLIFEGYYLD